MWTMNEQMGFKNKDHKGYGKYVNIVVALAVTAILFLILNLRWDIVYCLNDDLMIQSILSGRYSGNPSGKAVYLSEPLSGLLAFLYRLLPSLPWFGSFLAGCYALCFFLILYVSLERMEKDVKLTGKGHMIGIGCVCVLAVSIFCGFFLSQYLMIHYTVAAAVLGGTAIYLFLLTDDHGTWKDALRRYWLPVVILLLCYLVRTKVFFMVVPFLAVAGLYRILRTKKIVPYLAPLFLLGVGVLFLMLVERLCYGGAAWREYLDYNDARTELYDYGYIWDDEDALGYYTTHGYAPEEMAVYRGYNVLLNESLTAEDYRKIAAYGTIREGERTWVQKWKEGFWLYRHRMLGKSEDYPYNVVILALYIMAVLLAAGGKNKKCLWIIVLLGMVRSVVWTYLLAQGRYPERVVISLYLIELLVLLAMMIDSWKETGSGSVGKLRNKNRNILDIPKISDVQGTHDTQDIPASMEKRIGQVVNRMGIVLAGIFLMILAWETAYQTIPKTMEARARQLEVNREEDPLFEFVKAHPENLYLLDVYAAVYHTEYAVRDYDDTYENYLLLGGWTAGSPLVTEKLAGWGYASAFDALERGRNVYLVLKEGVGMDIKELEDFYLWRTGETAAFQKVETVGGLFDIYQKTAD